VDLRWKSVNYQIQRVFGLLQTDQYLLHSQLIWNLAKILFQSLDFKELRPSKEETHTHTNTRTHPYTHTHRICNTYCFPRQLCESSSMLRCTYIVRLTLFAGDIILGEIVDALSSCQLRSKNPAMYFHSDFIL